MQTEIISIQYTKLGTYLEICPLVNPNENFIGRSVGAPMTIPV
jgi:hypothetical protein